MANGTYTETEKNQDIKGQRVKRAATYFIMVAFVSTRPPWNENEIVA